MPNKKKPKIPGGGLSCLETRGDVDVWFLGMPKNREAHRVEFNKMSVMTPILTYSKLATLGKAECLLPRTEWATFLFSRRYIQYVHRYIYIYICMIYTTCY